MSKSNPYQLQINRYRSVSERLLTAISAQASARAAFEAARDEYDDQRQRYILDGFPGVDAARCSGEQRDAALGRALTTQTRALRTAREELRAADAELESAKVQERTEREALRSYQLARAD